MLAMVCNDNAGIQAPRGVLASIASMLAPTGRQKVHTKKPTVMSAFLRAANA